MNGQQGTGRWERAGRSARWLIHVLAALTVVLVPGCGRPTGSTAAVDAARIVSVAPALTAIVLDLGAGERLTGVTRNCTLPDDLAAKGGVDIIGDFSPIPERVMAAKPSVVLMADYASQAREREGLVALGLPVETFALTTLADLEATITRLGALVGNVERATALKHALDEAQVGLKACLASGARGPSFVMVYGTEPGFIYTTGGGDHISELLGLTGATNALTGLATSARVGLERVLEARPDLILHVAPNASFADSASARAFWARWPEIPAVAHGAVFVWPDDRLARNGAHVAGVAPELCALVRAASAPAKGTADQ